MTYKTPLISVVVPSSCRPTHVSHLIELFRDERNLELIVVHNGSNHHDISEYQNICINSQVKLITTPEKNAPKARNIGLAQANGEWTWFLDDDDSPSDNTIQEMRDCLIRAKNYDGLFLPNIRNNNPEIKRYPACQLDFRLARDIFKAIEQVNSSSFVIKTSFARQVLWNEQLKAEQDTDFLIRAISYNPAWETLREIEPVIINESTENRISKKPLKRLHGKLQMLYNHWTFFDWRLRARYFLSILLLRPVFTSYANNRQSNSENT